MIFITDENTLAKKARMLLQFSGLYACGVRAVAATRTHAFKSTTASAEQARAFKKGAVGLAESRYKENSTINTAHNLFYEIQNATGKPS
jgi:hypothetical protein